MHMITNYRDIVNNTVINDLKKDMSEACMRYNILVNEKSVKHRESNIYEEYNLQYSKDMISLKELRESAQNIADTCNKILFKIAINTERYFKDDLDNELVNEIMEK